MGKRKSLKNKAKKLQKQFSASLANRLKKDLEKLGKDWEDLLSRKQEPISPDFLKEVAEDIKQLSDDLYLAEEDHGLDESTERIHDFLETPWASPYEKNLLEAAISFEFQRPEESDLYQILSSYNIYSTLLSKEFRAIIESIPEKE